VTRREEEGDVESVNSKVIVSIPRSYFFPSKMSSRANVRALG